MRFIPLLAVLFVLPLSSVAQTVSLLQEKDTIYVGTDSRAFVKQTGRFFYAVNVPEDSLEVSEINRLAGHATGIDGLVDSCIAHLRLRYTVLFGDILKRDKDFFNKHIMRDQVSVGLGGLCFFGIEGGRPRLIHVIVYMNKGIKHPVVITASKQDQPRAVVTRAIGSLKSGIWGNRGLSRVAELKQDIALCTSRDPKEFVDPIDVLVLTPKGGMWTRQ